MRAAIYARYSSELQSENSIKDQVALCNGRAERESWAVVETFVDYALSGATMERPGLISLIETARSGGINEDLVSLSAAAWASISCSCPSPRFAG